jgi:hypothetical protein
MPAILNRLIAFLGRLFSQQNGFTSLQMAIGAVTALVVAGGVTTTVVVSSEGLSEEVDKQLTETMVNITGTYMIRSSIYGQACAQGPKGTLGQLIFTVGLVAAGGSADFTPPLPSPDNTGLAAPDSQNKIVISYTDYNQHVEDLYWTVTPIGQDDGDYILEEHELFQITVGGSATAGENGGNLVNALETSLSTSTNFSIEMGSSQGPVLAFDRNTPSYFRKLINFR